MILAGFLLRLYRQRPFALLAHGACSVSGQLTPSTAGGVNWGTSRLFVHP